MGGRPRFAGRACGQSYGGRQATILAADNPDLVAGLLPFSYPLHLPGKPDRLRVEHFPRLRVPSLFVSGTNDPFGSIAELRQAVALIPAPTRVIAIDGAGHDLRRGRLDLKPAVEPVQAGAEQASPATGQGTAVAQASRNAATRMYQGRPPK